MNWLNHTRSIRLDPRDVDLGDRTYHIPCFEDLGRLTDSIRQAGILNAPVLQERTGRRMISVLGRRRLLAAEAIGLSHVTAKAVPEAMPESEGFLLAFWDNLGHRSFDPAVTAVTVKRLLELFPREIVARRFLPLLGITLRGPRLERLRIIGGLEEPVLPALASAQISEKTANVLADLNPDDRRALLQLSKDLALNSNKAAEIIERLADLSVLHGKSVMNLLESSQAKAILENRGLPVPQRAMRFREMLRTWKFPELVRKEEQFNDWMDKMPHWNKVSVRPTPGFEDEKLTIQIKVESREQAERILARLGGEIR